MGGWLLFLNQVLRVQLAISVISVFRTVQSIWGGVGCLWIRDSVVRQGDGNCGMLSRGQASALGSRLMADANIIGGRLRPPGGKALSRWMGRKETKIANIVEEAFTK